MTSTPAANHPSPAQPLLDDDAFCPHCGYNLRGVESGRCPECGHGFDRASLKVSRIPWVHRRDIGRFRAYWRTVWLVTSKRRFLAEELSRPVSLHSANRFRWLTVLLVYLAFWLPVLAIYVTGKPTQVTKDESVVYVFAMIWPVAAVGVALFLALAAVTGLPGYLFHPRGLPVERQNQAITLSYYACAPLGGTPVLVSLVVAGVGLVLPFASFERAPSGVQVMSALLAVVGGLGLVLSPVWWFAALWWLGSRALDRHPIAHAMVATLPILWALALALIVGGVTFATGYVALILDSLR
jgi:hypothetical protein